jgi:hypothetical protein
MTICALSRTGDRCADLRRSVNVNDQRRMPRHGRNDGRRRGQRDVSLPGGDSAGWARPWQRWIRPGLIDLALSPADAGRGRPWPDLPLTALLRLGGGAVSELIVAGDTASDVESGLRAGAGVVAGVLTGSGSRKELEAAGAPHVLDGISGLLPMLGLGRHR